LCIRYKYGISLKPHPEYACLSKRFLRPRNAIDIIEESSHSMNISFSHRSHSPLGLVALGLTFLAPIAVRAQTQALYVTTVDFNSLNAGTVMCFTETGPGILAATPTTVEAGLGEPFGISFDRLNNLFVSSFNTSTITEFAVGSTPGTFGASTTLSGGGLNGPQGIAFDAAGNLFAANFTGNTQQGSITEFAAGSTPGTLRTGQVVETGVTDPASLAFDARGNLFAVSTTGGNSSSGSVTEFAAGATPGTFGPATVLNDPSLNLPRGVAIDARGDLFVADQLGNLITEFTAGTSPGTFAPVTTLTGGGLSVTEGLAFDANGNLFAANNGNGTITEFAAGSTSGTYGAGQIVATGLAGPVALAFGPAAPAAVPESSTTVSLGLLLSLGLGGVVLAEKKNRSLIQRIISNKSLFRN